MTIFSASSQRAHAETRARGCGDAVLARPGKTWSLPGIAGTTRIETSFGMVPAHLIRKRDPLRVGKNSYLQVQGIREYCFDSEFLAARPEALPIAIRGVTSRAGEVGGSIRVSSGQGVLVTGNSAGAASRFVPAEDLGTRLTPREADEGPLSYFRFIFEKPVQICAEGIWLECSIPDE